MAEIITRTRRRKMAFRANALAAVFLAALVAVMLNYIVARHALRWDVSRDRIHSISDKTKLVLDQLESGVDITVCFRPDSGVARDVLDLLREYESYSRRIKVSFVDPDRDLAAARELEQKHKVSEPDVVVISAGSRLRVVRARDLFAYRREPGAADGRGQRLFRGEQALSSAIYGVIQTNQPVVYMLKGHGERELDDFDRNSGYSGIERVLRRSSVDVEPLLLGEKGGVPRDADALVIAGPHHRFTQAELDFLREYLDRSGRLFLLLDYGADTGLETLLEAWGVRLGNDRVVGTTLAGNELMVTDYGAHEAVRALRNVTTLFFGPRSINPVLVEGAPDSRQADRPRVSVLAACSDRGWAETDFRQIPPRLDAADRPGPVPVAVAVERGPISGMDVDLKPTRLVIVGDSTFAANGALDLGCNTDFFMSALNWLLGREELLDIPPRPPDLLRILMSRAQLDMIFWIAALAMPGLAVLVWAVVRWRRRI